MLKKIKNISIVAIVIFYMVQLCIVFSGTLIENIQQIRYQNQVSKIHSTIEKIVTIKDWNDFENKKEIKINTIYYDVVSFEVFNDKIALKLVKDDFESELRISIQQLLNTKNAPTCGKKKCINFYNYLCTIESQKKVKFIFLNDTYGNLDCFFNQGNTCNIIASVYRPPC